jgi:glucosylceramidase
VNPLPEFGRMILRRASLLCLFTTLAVSAQSPKTRKHSPASRTQIPARIDVVESSEELHESLLEKPPLQFGSSRLPALTVDVDDSIKYQQIDGFGASLTDSSAWLISQKLSEAQRTQLLEMLFDPNKGIGLRILRQPMGASDFALQSYTYDDLPPGQTDPDMKLFSVDHDRAYIIPILRQSLALNPNLKIIGSPWSPPGWMKTSGSTIEGTLLPTAFAPLAKYFVKYVQAYEASGVPIFAVTPQNEPLNIPNDYPGMGMSADEQSKFVRENLGPAFRDSGIKSRILVFDHNWNQIEFPVTVLDDTKAAAYAAGTAIHCYGGTVTAQSELHNRFPEKGIWLTECSGGEWQKGKLLQEAMDLIIGATRNWAKSVVLWNLALDQEHKPYLGGCKTCRGIVTIDHSSSPTKVIPNVDLTALAHASKFLSPGAVRIQSNTFDQGSLESVAFRNPDGSIVLIVLNSGGAPTPFNISWKGTYASYRLDPASVATFRWSPRAKAH